MTVFKMPHMNQNNENNQSHEMQAIVRQDSVASKYKRLLNKLITLYKNDYLTTMADADHFGKVGEQMKEDVKGLLVKAHQEHKEQLDRLTSELVGVKKDNKKQIVTLANELEDVKKRLDTLIDLCSKSSFSNQK